MTRGGAPAADIAGRFLEAGARRFCFWTPRARSGNLTLVREPGDGAGEFEGVLDELFENQLVAGPFPSKSQIRFPNQVKSRTCRKVKGGCGAFEGCRRDRISGSPEDGFQAIDSGRFFGAAVSAPQAIKAVETCPCLPFW
jgi:hypothetical protein